MHITQRPSIFESSVPGVMRAVFSGRRARCREEPPGWNFVPLRWKRSNCRFRHTDYILIPGRPPLSLSNSPAGSNPEQTSVLELSTLLLTPDKSRWLPPPVPPLSESIILNMKSFERRGPGTKSHPLPAPDH